LKRPSLTQWLFIGMIAGIAVGATAPEFARQLAPLSSIFLRLIRAILAPLIFSTLVFGVAGAGDLGGMKRIALKTLFFFLTVPTIALLIGWAAGLLVRPGESVSLGSAPDPALPQTALTLGGFFEQAVPTSIVDAMARGDVLQIVIFSLLFGLACAAVGPKAQPVVAWCESLAEIMFRFTGYVMYLAPFGVGAAMAVTVGSRGLSVLFALSQLIVTLYAAMFLFSAVVLGGILSLFQVPVRAFLRVMREPLLIAFSTASSQASLPRALENMAKLGVPSRIAALVIPTGLSFNMQAAAMYLPLATLFVAQAAGIEISPAQQGLMLLTLIFTSKGITGVPRASMVILAGTLASLNLPVEGLAVLLGVDAVMDMGRTALNILGNCVTAAAVTRWEGVKLNADA
jgi:proton glutamate symport protein